MTRPLPDPRPEPTPTPGKAPEAGPLRVRILSALAVAAVAALAAPHLPPLGLGALVLAATLAAVWVSAPPGRDGNGHHRHVQVLRDELDASRRRYQRLFSSVPCFICVLDRDHNIVEANELYRREFGVTDRSLCFEVCKQRTSKCPNCIVDATFADGVSRAAEEILVARDGRRINTVVHTRPIRDEGGEITAVMEVFTDVTEVKQLQRQLALTGRAVAGAAHRVKNILMGLEGGIFIVNDGLERDDRGTIDEGWEMVERNVHRITAIVKDLLFTAKERRPSFEDEVCPEEIVLEVRNLYARRMEGENIEVLAEVPAELHRGTFDPDAIHNLLCNLVGNAIDACRFDPSEGKDGHRVVLRCWQNGNGATVFEVEDNGEGIPEELTRKVFHEFFSSKGTEGTGIGLLVVQKVAEEHGGAVTFRSTPGEGTVFTVTIPAHTPTAKPADHGVGKLGVHN